LAFPEPIQPCGSRRYFLRELAATSLLFPLPQRSGGIMAKYSSICNPCSRHLVIC
jgi:hypothetical protein